MHTPLIAAALRTPIGAFQGALKNIPPPQLAGLVLGELLHRTGITPSEVDEVILGNVLRAGLGQNPARQAAAAAGIPFSSSALTIDMVCGSGLRAVCLAGQALRLGEGGVVIAGGMENMSATPQLLSRDTPSRTLVNSMRRDGLTCAFRGEAMGVFAEKLAQANHISRDEQDRYSLESHRKTLSSIRGGLFSPEAVPVPLSDGEGKAFSSDECPRSDCTMEKLARIKPAFDKNGTVTAGNATPIADGAAAVIVVSDSYARQRDMRPLARILDWCVVGVEPEHTFAALGSAVKKILRRNTLMREDVDLFEIADSFAVEGIVCIRELGIPPEKVNVRGGTLTLGHPLGASGCRILVTLLHTLKDERKRLGLAAVCFGGGNALAML